MHEKESRMSNASKIKEDPKFVTWKTGMSQAFWCHTKEEKHYTNTFEPAIDLDSKDEHLSWFDRLLHGGIVVPETTFHPLTLLLTGPPGAGKTTFSLELVYRLINNEIETNRGKPEKLNTDPPNECIYISTESTSKQIIDKTKDFNWKNCTIFNAFQKNKRVEGKTDNTGNIVVYGLENIKSNGLKAISKKAIDSVEDKKVKFRQIYFFISISLTFISLAVNSNLLPIQIDNYIKVTILMVFTSLWAIPAILILVKKFIIDKMNLPIIATVGSLFNFTRPLFRLLVNKKDTKKIDILVIDSLNSA